MEKLTQPTVTDTVVLSNKTQQGSQTGFYDAMMFVKGHDFPIISQCTKWPLCLITQNEYIAVEQATATRLTSASHQKCSGLEIIAASIHCESSKSETKDISVPANDASVFGATYVWAISCVVISKTQRPRRERQRKANMETVAIGVEEAEEKFLVM